MKCKWTCNIWNHNMVYLQTSMENTSLAELGSLEELGISLEEHWIFFFSFEELVNWNISKIKNFFLKQNCYYKSFFRKRYLAVIFSNITKVLHDANGPQYCWQIRILLRQKTLHCLRVLSTHIRKIILIPKVQSYLDNTVSGCVFKTSRPLTKITSLFKRRSEYLN